MFRLESTVGCTLSSTNASRTTFKKKDEPSRQASQSATHPALLKTVRLRCWPILLLIAVQWTPEHQCNFLLLTIFLCPSLLPALRTYVTLFLSSFPCFFSPLTLIRISRFLFSQCHSLYFTSVALFLPLFLLLLHRLSILPFHEVGSRAKSMYV